MSANTMAERRVTPASVPCVAVSTRFADAYGASMPD